MFGLTSISKVLGAKKRVQKALGAFSKAHAEVEKAIAHLEDAKSKDLAKIEQLQATVAQAEAEMEANHKIKAKLADFVK